MKRIRYSPGGGFTLLEILTVLVLLAVLLALSGPMVNRIKHQAHATQCTGKLRQIGVGVNLYLAEHNQTLPVLAAGRDSRDDEVTPVLETEFLEYVDNEAVFKCPSDHEKLYEDTGSSYFWNSIVNGQRMGSLNMLGIVNEAQGIPLICDKENFHKHIGGEVNILYADGHILKELQFNVEMD